MNTHPMAEGGLLGGLTSLAGLSLILMPALFVVGQAAADIVLAVIGVLFLLHSLIARDWRWLAEPWIVVALAVWIYLMLNAAYVAADPVAANTRAQPFGRFIIFAAALQFWLFVRPLVRRWFLVVLALVLGFVLVDCLIQFWLGRDLFGRPYERLRLTGPFAERVPGDFLSRLSLPVLAMAFAATRATCRWRTVALVAGTCLLVLTIALTGERAALIMFAFGLGLLFLFLGGARRPLLITGLGSALLVGGAITLDPAARRNACTASTTGAIDVRPRRGQSPGAGPARFWRHNGIRHSGGSCPLAQSPAHGGVLGEIGDLAEQDPVAGEAEDVADPTPRTLPRQRVRSLSLRRPGSDAICLAVVPMASATEIERPISTQLSMRVPPARAKRYGYCALAARARGASVRPCHGEAEQ